MSAPEPLKCAPQVWTALAAAVCITAAALASSLDARAADEGAAAPDVSPYDAGYASEAAAGCPGMTLVAAIPPAITAEADFKRGQEMFKRYLEAMKAEGACKAALKLYDAETGKTARILRQQK